MLKVGIVGCGAIGSQLARVIESRFKHVARLSYVCDHQPAQIKRLHKKLNRSVPALSISELIRRSDFIIEAASQGAVHAVVPLALRSGKKVLVLSVGGLLTIPNLKRLKSKGLLFVPSGAVGGIDALLAARQGKLSHVTLTTTKPLASLVSAPFWKIKKRDPRKIRRPTLIFEGSAREAIRLFPQNVNVAATLSLAGIGPRKTQVRIIAAPKSNLNEHDIAFAGAFGRMRIVAQNVPAPENPKTSALAIYSAIAALEKVFASLKVGT